jgi:hypothetical protein
LNARLSMIKKENYYDVKGQIIGSSIDFISQEPAFSFQEGGLDLPVHLSSATPDPEKKSSLEPGSIRVEKFQGPGIALNQIHLPIVAEANQFEIPDRITVPLWGGQVNLNSFRLSNLLGDLKMETTVSLKDLDLIKLFPRQGVTGTLNGELGPIRMDKEIAVMDGSLKADVFEGSVVGKNWVIVQPFSSERIIQGDLYFNRLNLEPITRRFSFGKITGFVQGQVTQLAIRKNLPERFHLLVKTEEVPGVPKSIHIKAIENIGILGTGWGELDVLRKGINRWISVYAYREIGLTCDLDDDLFYLRGTIIEQGEEYLVRKPGLFGIDIINKNPDNEILFSDMMERIRSIRKKPQEGTGNENK